MNLRPVLLGFGLALLFAMICGITVWASGEEFDLKNYQPIFATFGAIIAAALAFAAATANAQNQRDEINDRRHREQAGARRRAVRICQTIWSTVGDYIFLRKETRENAREQNYITRFTKDKVKQALEDAPFDSEYAFVFTDKEHDLFDELRDLPSWLDDDPDEDCVHAHLKGQQELARDLQRMIRDRSDALSKRSAHAPSPKS